MKTNRGTMARGIRKAVELIQYPFGFLALYLAASLLPGDKIGFNVVGTIGMLVILAVIDAALSLPALVAAKRLEKDVLEPVPVRSEW